MASTCGQALLELVCVSLCSPLWLLRQPGPQDEMTVAERMTCNCHDAEREANLRGLKAVQFGRLFVMAP